MAQLGLRLRVFLFFGLMAVGALVLAAGAMALGWSRVEPTLPTAPFVTAFVAFSMLNTGLLLGIWLLFDENVAKPINRLSADLRMRVHADVSEALETSSARYLGDLAPAAAALTKKAKQGIEQTAARISRETDRLGQERKRLSALLSESPVATILVNAAQEIVLYDAQAADILRHIAPPRLGAQLREYFSAGCLEAAFSAARKKEAECELQPVEGGNGVQARIRALEGDGHMLFFDPVEAPARAVAQRPLVFDFDLLNPDQDLTLSDRPLSSLCFVILDLETTGLSVDSDKIVQIGAVRVLNGVLVAEEELSTYVNPGCPIPPESTRIHGVTDDDVAEAPMISEAARRLYHFSNDAVLVAHNAPFDIGLLKRHAKDIGLTWAHAVLDTVLLSAVAFGTTEDHSLDALCVRLGISIPATDRHTAIGDARATARALVCLLKMLEGQGYTTLGALRPAMEREARRLYSGG